MSHKAEEILNPADIVREDGEETEKKTMRDWALDGGERKKGL